MRHSDDFEFAILNNKYIEIAGNYGQKTFQGISFEIFLMKSCIWNPESDTLTSPVFVSVIILTENSEVDNNVPNKSR